MKRLYEIVFGFIYGISISVASVVALGYFDWFRDPRKIAHGCNELGKCPFPWYGWPIMYAYILGPATLAVVVNWRAIGKWKLSKWLLVNAVFGVSCVIAYFVGTVLFERL